MSDKFPKRTPSQAEGELGVAIFATAVRQALGWEFRRTPQEVDYGVDGYLDLVSEGGDVTGKSIAVQIKSGRSYFQFSDDDWVYRGERKHINYYTNLGVPLILVLVDTESHQIWWRRFSAYETDGNPSGWTIRIPKSNLLHVQSRSELAQVAGVAEDNLSHMDEIWSMPQKAKDMDFMCFAISRTEIETGDTMVFSKMLDRFKSAKEYLVAAHNKVEFSISGFDDDPRELYEIPMVVNWFKAMVQDVECLIYFLYMGPGSLALATTVHCLSGVRKIAKDTAELPDLAPVKAFVDHQYDRLNKFTERYDLETLNREISEKFAERMKGVIAPSGRAPKPAKRPKPTAKTKGKVRAPRK